MWGGGLPRALPPGYVGVPMSPQEVGAARLCVVMREGRPGGPVVLREGTDHRVLLGCLMDGAGAAREWLEVWVQDHRGLEGAPTSFRAALNNRALDERWSARAESLDRMDTSAGAGGLLRTGWESENPSPLFVDVGAGRAVPVKDQRNGGTWALCRDEGVLASKGVSGYSGTLSRHLYQPELGKESALIPVDARIDAGALGLPSQASPVNPGAGLVLVRSYAPLSFERFLDATTGSPMEPQGTEGLVKLLEAAALTGPGGWLSLGNSGGGGRVVESLHLKLGLLGQCVSVLREAIKATQAPFLNVTPETFRVRVSDSGGVLPKFWTARATLAQAGDSVELPVEGTQARYYLAGRSGVSIYAPAHLMRATVGHGLLRLRGVIAADAGGLILEGTLSTQERVSPGVMDLLWLRMTLGGERFDLYGTLDAEGGMTAGEVRVRTIPQRFSDATTARLRSAVGVPVPDVSFEVIPLLSAACDVYSMGVLATRALLVTRRRVLPIALDELFSLAAAAAALADSGEDLPARIRAVFESDPKWGRALGAHHLVEDNCTQEEASGALPDRLWHGVLACVVRMFTGLTPDSRCRDFGDAPPGGQQRVFDPILDDLYALLKSCRTLITADYAVNAEIRSVVRGCMKTVRA